MSQSPPDLQSTVLHIEDNEGDRLIIEQFLSIKEGYKLDHAVSLSTGLALLSEKHVDIVLIDLGLPDVDGLEAITRVRQVMPDGILIVLSGRDHDAMSLQVIKHGADDFISKHGLNANFLNRVIRHNIDRKQQRATLNSENNELRQSIRRLQSLNEIYENHASEEVDHVAFALKKALELTGSSLAYFMYYRDAAQMLELVCRTPTLEEAPLRAVTSLKVSGILKRALEQSEPLVINTSEALSGLELANIDRLERLLAIPLIESGKTVALACIANKSTDYDQSDASQSHDLLKGFWSQLKRLVSERQNTGLVTALNQVPVSIVLTNLAGDIEYVNPYFTERTGFAVHEVLGKNPRILKSGKQDDQFYGQMWQTISKGHTWSGEMENKAKDGTAFWEDVTITPVCDANGLPEKFIAVKKDITQIKIAEEQAQLRERLLDDTQSLGSTGGWQYDVKHMRWYWTKALFEIYGIDQVEEGFDHATEIFKYFDKDDRLSVIEAYDACVKKGIPYDLCVRFTDFKGRKKWVRTKTSAVLNEQNEVVKVIGSIKDISDEKQRELELFNVSEEMRTTKSFLESMVDHTNVGLAMINKEGAFIYANQGFSRLMGYSLEELRSINFRQIQSEDLYDLKLQYFDEIEQGKRNRYEIEQEYRRKDGSTLWTSVSVNAVRNDQGKLIYLVGAMVDISKRKEHEAALLKSERSLQKSEALKTSVIASLSEGLVVREKSGEIIIANAAACKIMGLTFEQLNGKEPFPENWKIFDDKGIELNIDTLPGMISLKTGKYISNFILHIRSSGSAERIVSLTSSPVIDTNGIVRQAVTTLEDITPRYEAEQKIKSISRRLNYALEGTQAATWDLNMQTGETIYNERWAEIIGYELKELEPLSLETWRSLTHPEDYIKVTQLLEKHFAGELDYYDCRLRMKHKKGHWVWIWDRGKVVEHDQDGKPLRLVGTQVDISDWVKAEETLKASEERYRLIYDSMGIGVGYYTIKGNVIRLNDVALNSIGRTAAEVEGKHITEIYESKNASTYVKRLASVLKTDSMTEYIDQVGTNGDAKWFKSLYSAVKNDKGEVTGMLIISENITGKKKIELALEESEKQYRFLTESLTEVVWQADESGKIRYINEYGHQKLKLAEGGMGENGWFSIVHQEDLENVKQQWTMCIKDKKAYSQEQRLLVRDGSYHWFKVSARPLLDDQKHVISWTGLSIDINQQVLAQQTIQQDRARMQFLAEKSSEFLRQESSQALYQYIASELFELFGQNAVVIVNEFKHNASLFEIKAMDGIEQWFDKFMHLFNFEILGTTGNVNPESVPKLKSGKVIKLNQGIYDLANGALPKSIATGIEKLIPPHEILSIGFIEDGNILGNAHLLVFENTDAPDNTLIELFCAQASAALARFQAIDLLRLSEERFRGVVASFKDIIYTLDTEGRHTALYGTWVQEAGMSPKDFIGKTAVEIQGKEAGSIHEKAFNEAKEGGIKTYEWTRVNQYELKHFQTTLTPLINKEGSIYGYLGVGRDITDRWNHEQGILENTARLKKLAHFSNDLMGVNEKQKIYEYISAVIYDIIGNKGYVTIAEIQDNPRSFEIKALSGINHKIEQALKLIGQSVVGIRGPVNEELISQMKDHDIVDLPLDLNSLVDQSLTKKFTPFLLKKLGVGQLKFMLIYASDVPIATVTMALSTNHPQVNSSLIRAFLNQASLALARAEIVDGILRSEQNMKEAQRIAKLGNWYYDLLADRYHFSDEAKRILGIFSNDAISNKDLIKRLHPDDVHFVNQHYYEVSKGRPVNFEHRILVDHQIKWLHVISTPVIDSFGSILRAEGTIHDITERKQSELQLEESESRFRNLIEHSSDVIFVEDTGYHILYTSPSVKQVLGYEEHEILGIDARELIHPNDLAKREKGLEKIIEGNASLIQFKERLRKKSGKFIWVLATFTDQRQVQGVNGIVLNFKDVDEEERTRIELQKSHERFRFATEATNDVVWDRELGADTVIWGGAWTSIFGHPASGKFSQDWTPHVHKNDLQAIVLSLNDAIEDPETNRWSGQYRFMKSNGEFAWVLDNATIIRDENNVAIRMIGAMNDITERIQYENSIEEQNSRLKDIAWMQSHLVRAPLANLMALINIRQDHHDADIETLDQMIYESADKLDKVIRNVVKNAERFEYNENATSFSRYHILNENIEELYLHPALLDLAPLSYSITNKKDQIVYVNAAFEILSGYNFDEIKGKKHSEILVEPGTNDAILGYIHQKENNREPYEAEIHCHSKSGHRYWLRLLAQPFISKEGVFSGFFYTLKDISREKEAEATILEKTQTLAHINDELKHFTYTISHDLKEPVNSLKGLLGLLLLESKNKLSTSERDYIDKAMNSLHRMSKMVQALLEYSRSGNTKEEPKKLLLSEVIEEVKGALRTLIEAEGAVVKLVSNDMYLTVYPIQFSRIIQNLVYNGIKFRSADAPVISINISEDPDFYHISVSDNGMGIATEDLPQIFDLFYFKNQSQQSESHGIGLAVVKRLVEQHGGQVQVTSSSSKGTTFAFTIRKLKLPQPKLNISIFSGQDE